MSKLDTKTAYMAGWRLINQGVKRTNSKHGCEHLFIVELRPDIYPTLGLGLDTLAERSTPDCLVKDSPVVTIPKANSALNQVEMLGRQYLTQPTCAELARLIGNVRRNIGLARDLSEIDLVTEEDTEIMALVNAGLSGAVALYEMVFCPESRTDIVRSYYGVRPSLVLYCGLPSIENLQRQGKTPPLYKFR